MVWGGLPCVYWPVQTHTQPKPITAKGAAPILVIGTLRDPATPYKWAKSLSSQLSSGVLLTLDGDGHTAYLQSNPCISRATDGYLLTGQPPRTAPSAADARTPQHPVDCKPPSTNGTPP
ncbi:alpha/beta hydrolase [Actinomadura yumaensis]|uniref:alpha/beta hydrolase n=1 Tax=Actinomadura yumaensis TaxID=111807 RepID=UPI00360C981B